MQVSSLSHSSVAFYGVPIFGTVICSSANYMPNINDLKEIEPFLLLFLRPRFFFFFIDDVIHVVNVVDVVGVDQVVRVGDVRIRVLVDRDVPVLIPALLQIFSFCDNLCRSNEICDWLLEAFFCKKI